MTSGTSGRSIPVADQLTTGSSTEFNVHKQLCDDKLPLKWCSGRKYVYPTNIKAA